MKKILSVLISASIVAGAVAPMAALAQPAESCTLKHDGLTDIDPVCVNGREVCDVGGPCPSNGETTSWGMCCILDAVYTVTDWIFIGLVAIVSVLTIWGGVTISTAGGSEEKITKGRNYILFAMVGLAVALLSKAVPSVVKALIGVA
jgi:hypothetical protein